MVARSVIKSSGRKPSSMVQNPDRREISQGTQRTFRSCRPLAELNFNIG